MVRTRIAPSPTGNDIHIGNLYTAMINYCFAKELQGQFLIRIEDTDRTRLVKGAEAKILKSLEAYGITADESPKHEGKFGPYRQSDRLDIYKKYAEKLIESGHAYYCTCSKERLDQVRKTRQQQKQIPKYDKHCLLNQKSVLKEIKNGQPYVIRLNVPENQLITFTDIVRGQISINTKELDDQVLLKSDGYPTYHLAVVIDDHLMEITHVIRAEEWLPSTPKHILLYKAFGWKLPLFAHLPILRNPDHSKLSKRKNPVWAAWYLEEGFLPEAVLNYLALMGWSHPDEREMFSLSEFQRVFKLEDIQKTAPVFDPVKLEWLNGEYLRSLSPDILFQKISQYYAVYRNQVLNPETLLKTIPLIQTRIKKLSDYWDLAAFIYEQPTIIEFPLNIIKQHKMALLTLLEQTEWRHPLIYKALEQFAKKESIKGVKLYMELRYALANRKVTAPLFEGMEVIGKTQVLSRIKKVLA